jgi:hypothetical protein
VPAGWEGVHVFDIHNPADPTVVAAVELPRGSHTLTVAGIAGGRLIVYSNNSSSSGCGVGLDLAGQNAPGAFIDVSAVPLDDPAGASLIHREPLAGPTDPTVRTGCHDAAVILGDVNPAACASAQDEDREPALVTTAWVVHDRRLSRNPYGREARASQSSPEQDDDEDEDEDGSTRG